MYYTVYRIESERVMKEVANFRNYEQAKAYMDKIQYHVCYYKYMLRVNLGTQKNFKNFLKIS